VRDEPPPFLNDHHCRTLTKPAVPWVRILSVRQ
jgi:hypothetical protein